MPDAQPEIVLASQNPGKVAEMRELLAGQPWRVRGVGALGIHEAPEETGTTFRENALLKARYYAGRAGGLVVADDSGLSVDALDGAPGLYTSRFGGPGLSDDDRNRLLLRKLDGVAEAERGARFTSAVALVRNGEILFEAVETCEGRIASEAAGDQGFGYDPVFFYPPFGTTMGCVPPEQKATVSHRGKAFARLAKFLATL
jgi:XTP/dITP diphosphohydrolase